MNLAQLNGWIVLEYTAQQIDLEAIRQIKVALGV